MLAKDQELAARMETNLPDDGIQAVLSLAWGLLLDYHGPPNFRGQRLEPTRSHQLD